MRILFIDAARAVAILGAIGYHAMMLRTTFMEAGPAGRLFANVALGFMPLFLFLFGVSLELIYHRRAAQTGVGTQTRTLLRRALACYGCYLVTIAVPALLGEVDPARALRMAVLLAPPVFWNDILPLWVILLSLSGGMLLLRARVGPGGMLAAGFAVWFVVPHLYGGPWPSPKSAFAVPVALLTGYPHRTIWTDLAHTLVFVGAGICLGGAIARSRQRGAWGDYRRVLLLLGVATLALAAGLALSGDHPARWVSTSWRRQLRAGYFLFGMLDTLAVVGLCSLLLPPSTAERPWHRLALGSGRSSLFAFSLSSCLLSLGSAFPGAHPSNPAAFAALHVALVAAAAAAATWWRGRESAGA